MGVGRVLGTAAAVAGAVHGYRKDKGNKGTKKVAKAVILGGGYSGYERARNQSCEIHQYRKEYAQLSSFFRHQYGP